MRLGYEDAVLNMYGPITYQAAEEFEAAFAELRRRLDFGDGSVAVLGGSIGAAVAQLVIVESAIDISSAVLVNPLVQLRPTVEAAGRHFNVTYPWSAPSLEVARRLDFVARAEETTQRGQPAVLLVVGSDDDLQGFREPAQQLHDFLANRYADPKRVELVVVPGMGHALAEEPGIEPAPQTEHASQVDAHAVRWLRRHLVL
jgi:pimeloyl-ACP methyl ester carboxylesterase